MNVWESEEEQEYNEQEQEEEEEQEEEDFFDDENGNQNQQYDVEFSNYKGQKFIFHDRLDNKKVFGYQAQTDKKEILQYINEKKLQQQQKEHLEQKKELLRQKHQNILFVQWEKEETKEANKTQETQEKQEKKEKLEIPQEKEKIKDKSKQFKKFNKKNSTTYDISFFQPNSQRPKLVTKKADEKDINTLMQKFKF